MHNLSLKNRFFFLYNMHFFLKIILNLKHKLQNALSLRTSAVWNSNNKTHVKVTGQIEEILEINDLPRVK